jgi:uncharacterized protein (TIGR02246 family)
MEANGTFATARQGDIEALGAIIADVQAGFNDNDPELLAAHFTEDGTAVNVMGVLVEGRDAMVRTSRELLAGPLKEERARYELGDVVFLTPDVAVAHKTARAIDRDGVELDDRDVMIALYVFVRRDGRWLIAARQNTLIR